MEVEEPFGDSPFIDAGREEFVNYVTTKKRVGGDAKSGTALFKYIMITLLVIFVVYLLYRIVVQVKRGGEDYYQRRTHQHFDNIHGEAFDAEAKQTIEFGEAIPNPRAIDHYRVGTVYLVNARNPQRAHHHFRQALDQITAGMVDTREAPFIINRIDDFKDHFFDFPEIEELPVQNALLAFYNQNAHQVQAVARKRETLAPDDPEFKQKLLVSRQEWQSDSQNVHDSAMYQMLGEQFNKTRDENLKLKNIQLHDYREAVQWMKTRYAQDPDKISKLDKVLHMINRNEVISGLPHAKEQDILTTVWQRSYDPDNKDRADEIRESMADAVLDCVEGNSVVCMSGRTKKVWQALARLDKDDDNGVLKSKQAIRNEIYQKAAKVVDDYIGENGSASVALKEAYNKSENTEQVKELMETVKGQIEDIRGEYVKLLPHDQLTAILEECKAVVG
jgi:hypothetical protein